MCEYDFPKVSGSGIFERYCVGEDVQAGDVAIAWTYLYEYPGDIKATAAVRANSAADIVELYSNGISTSCGGNLVAGGMNLEQAIKFMEDYKTGADSATYIGGAGQD